MSTTVEPFVHFLYYHFLKVLFNQVSQAEWGAGEPGLVGDCAVMDSGMKCPRPPVPEAARLDPADQEQLPDRDHWWEEGVSLVLVCETGQIDG